MDEKVTGYDFQANASLVSLKSVFMFPINSQEDTVMKRICTQHFAALLVASLLGFSVDAQAYTMTLSNPIQSGDYLVAAKVGSNLGFYQVRPTNSAETQVVFSSGDLTSTDTVIGGTFNHATGDFYYWSGPSGGKELRVIKAGQTSSTLLIPNLMLRPDGSSSTSTKVSSLAVTSDGTVYALIGSAITKFTLNSGTGAYQAVNRFSCPDNASNPSAQMRAVTGSNGSDYVVCTENHGVTTHIFSFDSTGTILSSMSPASSTDWTSPVNRPMGIAVDYNNPLSDGKLRVLVSNYNAVTATDGITRRITELALDPTTGILSNPFSDGSGNLASLGNSNAQSLAKANSGSQVFDIQFDNNGNLIVMGTYLSQNGYQLSPSQLYPGTTSLDLTTGTVVWDKKSTGLNSISSLYSMDIAPMIPEPVSMMLLGAGSSILIGYRRNR